MKHFKLLLYFWCNVFGEIREMPQCVNASLFLVLWVFFGKNRDIFVAIICDMAKERLADRRYFFEIVHDWIKTDFMRKRVASSYIQMIFIVCCFLLTGPNKEKQCHACYRWCLLSVYHDIVTCSQQKLKNFLFFICLVDNHISLDFTWFLMLVWWHKSRYGINYSHFFRGGWRGVLKWCSVWTH